MTAKPKNLQFATLTKLANAMTSKVPGVVSVTYNIAQKPPSTIEAV
jgi:GMP synthase (glutamine-hydrolysing)